MTDDLARCWWTGAAAANADPLMVVYHDAEWGVPADWPLVHRSVNAVTQTTVWRRPER